MNKPYKNKHVDAENIEVFLEGKGESVKWMGQAINYMVMDEN